MIRLNMTATPQWLDLAPGLRLLVAPLTTALMVVALTAGDTVELQGYFRVADGYFAADDTSFWGCKIG